MSVGFCLYCAREHDELGESCPSCIGGCKNLCQRLQGCRWLPEPKTEPVVVETAPLTVQIDTKLQDAFQAWLASSDGIKVLKEPGILWAEFESFAQENLTQVDQTKNYLQVVQKGDKMSLQDLTKEHLFRNQDGKYVLMDGKRRIRIGRVAVLEG